MGCPVMEFCVTGLNLIKKRVYYSGKVKPVDSNDKDTIIRQKDEEILRLRAENEYLKKLRAVVQARKDRQPKK